MRIDTETLKKASENGLIDAANVEALQKFIIEENKKNNLSAISIISIIFSAFAFLGLLSLSFSSNNKIIPIVTTIVFCFISNFLFQKFQKLSNFKIASFFDSIFISLLYISIILIIKPDLIMLDSTRMSLLSFVMALFVFYRYKQFKLSIQPTQFFIFLGISLNFLCELFFNDYNNDIFNAVNFFLIIFYIFLSILLLFKNVISREGFNLLNHCIALFLFVITLSAFDFYKDIYSFFVIFAFIILSFVLKNKSYLIYGIISLYSFLFFILDKYLGDFETSLILLILSCLLFYFSNKINIIENKINFIKD